MTVSTCEAGAAFADIVYADQQWVDAEFDALISASFTRPPAPPRVPPRPGTPPPPSRQPAAGPAAIPVGPAAGPAAGPARGRQRSPPFADGWPARQ